MFKFKRLRGAISTRAGLPQLKESYDNIFSVVKEIAGARKNREEIIPETFEAAVGRLGLAEADLERKKVVFFRTSLVYLAIAIILLIYWVVLVSAGTILGIFIDSVLVVMMLALAYREHFWYTQIKYRRLGITFKEWIGYTFKGGVS